MRSRDNARLREKEESLGSAMVTELRALSHGGHCHLGLGFSIGKERE